MAGVSSDSRFIFIIRYTSRVSKFVSPKECNHIQTTDTCHSSPGERGIRHVDEAILGLINAIRNIGHLIKPLFVLSKFRFESWKQIQSTNKNHYKYLEMYIDNHTIIQ